MPTSAEFLSEDIQVNVFFSCAKWAFYFIAFLHEDTGNVDALKAAEITYDVRLKMTIVVCFWEKETRDISFLDDREKSASEIVQVFDRIITKCLIGNTALISSTRHEKSCCFKRSLIGISMHKSSGIGVDAEEKSRRSLRRDVP